MRIETRVSAIEWVTCSFDLAPDCTTMAPIDRKAVARDLGDSRRASGEFFRLARNFRAALLVRCAVCQRPLQYRQATLS